MKPALTPATLAGLTTLRAYVRRYPLGPVGEREGWTVPEARTRALDAARRLLTELRDDGVTVGAEEDAEAAAYVIGEAERPPAALVALGLGLLNVVRELNDGDGLAGSTVAALEEALEEVTLGELEERACAPVRVRRPHGFKGRPDVGTVLNVGTLPAGGRLVLAVLVRVDNAGPDCREWWPAADCDPVPDAGRS